MAKITEKGQVTIPKRYRDKYGLRNNVEVQFIEKKGFLALVKASAGRTAFHEVVGVLAQDSGSTDLVMKRLRGK